MQQRLKSYITPKVYIIYITTKVYIICTTPKVYIIYITLKVYIIVYHIDDLQVTPLLPNN